MGESDSPRVLLERRLRWLVEVLCGSSVFCWWLLSMGLVAMMLSLYLFIRASLVLSFTVEKVGRNCKRLKAFSLKRQSSHLGGKKKCCSWLHVGGFKATVEQA